MLNIEVGAWGFSLRLHLGRGMLNMKPMGKKVVIDCDGRPENPESIEAFVVCDYFWAEKGLASGGEAFDWGVQTAWTNSDLWCLSSDDFRKKRPDFVNQTVYSIIGALQEKGYKGPVVLAEMADWAGIKRGTYEVGSPLGRCQLMAAIMRSPRLR